MAQIMTVEELREYIRTMPADEILHVTFEIEEAGKENADGGNSRKAEEVQA